MCTILAVLAIVALLALQAWGLADFPVPTRRKRQTRELVGSSDAIVAEATRAGAQPMHIVTYRRYAARD